jgi:hypothetical protein
MRTLAAGRIRIAEGEGSAEFGIPMMKFWAACFSIFVGGTAVGYRGMYSSSGGGSGAERVKV